MRLLELTQILFQKTVIHGLGLDSCQSGPCAPVAKILEKLCAEVLVFLSESCTSIDRGLSKWDGGSNILGPSVQA